jgi:hypothetical protein
VYWEFESSRVVYKRSLDDGQGSARFKICYYEDDAPKKNYNMNFEKYAQRRVGALLELASLKHSPQPTHSG